MSMTIVLFHVKMLVFKKIIREGYCSVKSPNLHKWTNVIFVKICYQKYKVMLMSHFSSKEGKFTYKFVTQKAVSYCLFKLISRKIDLSPKHHFRIVIYASKSVVKQGWLGFKLFKFLKNILRFYQAKKLASETYSQKCHDRRTSEVEMHSLSERQEALQAVQSYFISRNWTGTANNLFIQFAERYWLTLICALGDKKQNE